MSERTCPQGISSLVQEMTGDVTSGKQWILANTPQAGGSFGQVRSEEGTLQGGEVSQKAGPDLEKEAECASADMKGGKGLGKGCGLEGGEVL